MDAYTYNGIYLQRYLSIYIQSTSVCLQVYVLWNTYNVAYLFKRVIFYLFGLIFIIQTSHLLSIWVDIYIQTSHLLSEFIFIRRIDSVCLTCACYFFSLCVFFSSLLVLLWAVMEIVCVCVCVYIHTYIHMYIYIYTYIYHPATVIRENFLSSCRIVAIGVV